MLTTPIPTPLPGPSPRIRSWRVSRASHKAPRPPKPHNLCHEPLLQDTSLQRKHLSGFAMCQNPSPDILHRSELGSTDYPELGNPARSRPLLQLVNNSSTKPA